MTAATTTPRIELANLDGRAQLLHDGRLLDVERRSQGRFSADPMSVLARWGELCTWAKDQRSEPSDPRLDPTRLGPCVPAPRQVFAIGLNYRDHAREAKLPEPAQPMVFTKFPSCVTGPHAEIPLQSDAVDFELELVVVVGKLARNVQPENALAHVAGYCVGQDISDRRLQFASSPPQFSLGKSAPGYGPLGPTLVSAASIDPGALRLRCDVNGERMQDGTSADMMFPVPTIIAYLSQHCALLPGDVIFTGTPAGVGAMRTPPRFLQAGDLIRSEIVGLGVLENRCVAAV